MAETEIRRGDVKGEGESFLPNVKQVAGETFQRGREVAGAKTKWGVLACSVTSFRVPGPL